MIPIDLSGKVALVTGVANDLSFAWFISKALQAAGARLIFSCHPRMIRMVEGALTSDRPDDVASRVLPFGAGTLKPEKTLPCDVSFDTMADVDEKTRADRRYSRYSDYSIQGTVDAVGKEFGGIDILIHSIAFSPEIKNPQVQTSRAAYLTALGVSAYSLTGLLRAARPYMEDRPDGAAALGLTYLGGDRVVPHYGGGMSTAKAALQIDAKQLASNLGPQRIRVNLISAGPYASRAASTSTAVPAAERPSWTSSRRFRPTPTWTTSWTIGHGAVVRPSRGGAPRAHPTGWRRWGSPASISQFARLSITSARGSFNRIPGSAITLKERLPPPRTIRSRPMTRASIQIGRSGGRPNTVTPPISIPVMARVSSAGANEALRVPSRWRTVLLTSRRLVARTTHAA